MIKSFLPILGLAMFRPIGDRDDDDDFDDEEFVDIKAIEDFREEDDTHTYQYETSQPPQAPQPYKQNMRHPYQYETSQPPQAPQPYH